MNTEKVGWGFNQDTVECVVSLIEQNGDSRLLNIGCSTGIATRQLYQFLKHVDIYGTDVSKK